MSKPKQEETKPALTRKENLYYDLGRLHSILFAARSVMDKNVALIITPKTIPYLEQALTAVCKSMETELGITEEEE